MERTCKDCGHTGIDVSEQPTYSVELKRDTTDWFCDDIPACLDRQYTGTPYAREKSK